MRVAHSAQAIRRTRLWLSAVAGLLVAVLVFTMGTTALATTLLSDNFEDNNAAGWTATAGSWTIRSVGGSLAYYQGASAHDARSLAGPTSWTDYAVTGRVQPTAFNGTSRYTGLIARAQNNNNYYSLTINNSNRVELSRRVNGTTTVLNSTAAPIAINTWYTLRLEVTGTTLRGYLNNQLTNTATDSQFTSGNAGVAAYYARSAFDDIDVSTLGGGPTPTSAPPTTTPPPPARGSTVAADGTGNYRTVQAAVDAVPTSNSSTFTISIKAGTYREIVVIPSNKRFITLRGTGATPRDVIIVNNRPASEYGAASATVTINAADFTATNLTISNDYDESSTTSSARQALALNITAPRCIFDRVRALGNQDTMFINPGARIYAYASYVEGDVDFIYGRGTAVFHESEIHSTIRPTLNGHGGYITAAATPSSQTYGFLFYRSKLTGDGPANYTYLGRPWHPGGDVDARGQVVFRESVLGPHIRTVQPWTEMGGFPWTTGRFFEYRNTGPGAATGPTRPQLTDSQAADYTPQKYLAGSDGWNPVR